MSPAGLAQHMSIADMSDKHVVADRCQSSHRRHGGLATRDFDKFPAPQRQNAFKAVIIP